MLDQLHLKCIFLTDYECLRQAQTIFAAPPTSATGARLVGYSSTETELVWFGKHYRPVQLASMEQTVTVGASVIKPSLVVRDIGVLLDKELGMTQHIHYPASISCGDSHQIRRPVVQLEAGPLNLSCRDLTIATKFLLVCLSQPSCCFNAPKRRSAGDSRLKNE